MIHQMMTLNKNQTLYGIYFSEEECNKALMHKLLTQSKNIMFVFDEDYNSAYEMDNLASASVYKIIKEKMISNYCQLPFNKFLSLSQLGAFNFDIYEYIIFYLNKITKPMALIYSFLKIKKKSLFFLKETKKEDTIVLGLPFRTNEKIIKSYNCSDKYLNKNKEKIKYRLVIIESPSDKKIEQYYILKNLVKDIDILKRIKLIEDISFMLAYQYLKSFIRVNNLNRTIKQVDQNEMESLLKNEIKFKNLVKILSNSKRNFVVICRNEEIFKLLKLFNFQCSIISYKAFFYGEKETINNDSSNELTNNEFSFLNIKELCDYKNLCVLKEKPKYKNIFEEKINKENTAGVSENNDALSGDDISFEMDIKENIKTTLIYFDFLEIEYKREQFDDIIIFHEIKSSFQNFLKLKKNKIETEFINYKMEMQNEDENFNVQRLRTHFYLLKKYFDDHLLYFNMMELKFIYEGNNDTYICLVNLPSVHEHRLFSQLHKSNIFPTKKIAQENVCKEIISKLKKEGFADENLFPTSKYLQEMYKAYIKNIYNLNSFEEAEEYRNFFIMNKCSNSLVNEYTAYHQFKTKHSIDLIDKERQEIKVCYPNCLTYYPKKFSIYVYEEGIHEDFDLGLCCARSFTCEIKQLKIKFLYEKEFTNDELILIFFFQLIFFGLHFKKLKISLNQTKSCYFILPIRKQKVDFKYLTNFYQNFIIKNVFESNENFHDNLLFNPITKLFYVYKGESDKSILENIVPCSKTQGNEEAKYFVSQEITHYISYAEYFETKYNLQLKYKSDDRRLLFLGGIYTGKNENNNLSILASEIMQVTCIKRNLGSKFDLVLKFIYEFQNLAMANELKENLNLKLNLENIKICLTPNKGTGEMNYERFEFLGDAFLKFYCSKEQFFRYNTLKELVLNKCSLISNDNLCRIAEELKIPNYFSLVSLPAKSFQPPNLLKFIGSYELKDTEILKNYINYFKADKIFQSGRIDLFCSEMKNKIGEIPFSRKVYADIIEALIGMHYYEFGYQEAFKFISKLNLTGNISEKMNSLNDNFLDIIKNNTNSLTEDEIYDIENKLNYTFTNKGIIEKVIFHPSYERNHFGSQYFQALELLGDCSLDLIVTVYIFYKYPSFQPNKLHCVRKGMVNNFSLARVLKYLNLFPNIKTSVQENKLEEIKEILNSDGLKVNKMFADIFEAFCGAILVDCDFNINKFESFVKNILHILEECADFTR